MSQMNDLTVSLLSNDEILDINQDPLGRPETHVRLTWRRNLKISCAGKPSSTSPAPVMA